MSDLISREVVIGAVKRLSLGETDATRLAMRIGDYLKRVPSAQPERIRGRWAVTPVYIKCSECGECYPLIPQNFCPHCGADMRGEELDETD